MKKIIFLLGILCVGIGAHAQDTYTSLHYDISIPLSNTQDFVSKGSWRGVGFDYRNKVTTNLALGFNLGWHVFYEQKNYDTYTEGSLSLSGVRFNYINAYPMMANATYFLGIEDADFQPFLGFGVGTTFFETRTEMGLFQSTTNSWNFTMLPEAGMLYRFNYATALMLAAKYNISLANSKIDAQGYLTFNVGFAWTID